MVVSDLKKSTFKDLKLMFYKRAINIAFTK